MNYREHNKMMRYVTGGMSIGAWLGFGYSGFQGDFAMWWTVGWTALFLWLSLNQTNE